MFTVLVLMLVPMLMMAVLVTVGVLAVPVFLVVMSATVAMRSRSVDVEFHALDVLPLGAVGVHVEFAEVQLSQLPFECARLHAEVDEGAHHHVAADAGNAVQVE